MIGLPLLALSGCAKGELTGDGGNQGGWPNPGDGGDGSDGTDTPDPTGTDGTDSGQSGSDVPPPGDTDTGDTGDTSTDPGDTNTGGGTGDTSTGDTGTGDTGTDTGTGTGTDTGTDPEPTSEHLQNHDGTCERALWCTDAFGGLGAHENAECFSSVSLTPPFQLDEIQYQISQTESMSHSSVALQVLAWTGSAPGSEIGSQTLMPTDLATGDHTITIDSPIQIDASGFCIAIVSDGAFSTALDESNSVPDHAFIKAPECELTSWQTTVAAEPNSAGNWCISADISK